MKILKKENIENWSFICNCVTCNSELQVESGDLAHTRYDGYPRESGYDSFHALCAVYGNTLSIPTNKIPKLIQHQTKSKKLSYNYFRR